TFLRAPVYKLQNPVPRAHGFKRTSTGVRRSPQYVPTSPTKMQSKPMRAPLSMPAITLPSILPMSLPVVTFPPLASFPSMPTLSTIAMPTLPGLTMPPSFQRLLGISTPSPVRTNRENNTSKRLSPVSSRLPKFVNARDVVVVTPEENADWIVPF
uniref:Proline rich protein n=1 Tax=Angiostrongylus cantonensis TaxID=6313 RepID=A0A0K0DIE4_ANGCA